jgi:hypothetical protein
MAYDPPRAYTLAEALQATLDAIVGVQAYILAPLDDRPAGGYVWAQVGGVQSWADRMDGLASDASGSIILHCCGYSAAQAINTDDRVAAALLDWRWSTDTHVSPLRCVSTSPVSADRSVPSDVRWGTTRTYRWDA